MNKEKRTQLLYREKNLNSLIKAKPYAMKMADIFTSYKSSANGLNDEQVKESLDKYGNNELQTNKPKSKLMLFLEQFKDLMIFILFASALLSAFVSIIQGHYNDLIDVAIILAIVILNAVIGYVQQRKASNALAKLKKMSQPFAKVYRNGLLCQIPTHEVVVGDVLYLEAGNVVCADCYIIESNSLRCDESSLTGESINVEKIAGKAISENSAVGDRNNIAHCNTVVTYGRGKAVVVAVGMATQVGQIAGILLKNNEQLTPIQQKIQSLGKIITITVLLIATLIFVTNVLIKDTHDVMTSLMIAIAIAVAAIPESLPAIITIIMSTGVARMSKKNSIVRKMQAVETLGCCQIICSDKTGTLTQNKMTVTSIYCNDIIYDNTQLSIVNHPSLTKGLLLCNDCVLQNQEIIGDPTENALIEYTTTLGYDMNIEKQNYSRIAELPFDSDRKMMTTFNKVDNKIIGYTKGAPDNILSRCDEIEINGVIYPFTPTRKKQVDEALDKLNMAGLRTLAFAYKVQKDTDYSLKDEKEMIFTGIVAMRDPPRENTKDAVTTCFQAGIKPIMITGDHLVTAREIAREVGIYHEQDMAITGRQLDEMNDTEFRKVIKNITVYARVSPQNKVRIVENWQKLGYIVGMTGDGVNDAPSIKTADIGIGMGKSGTEVTKEVADIVLTDDNFATIVDATNEGRRIYQNICKVIQFLFGTNLVEVLTILIATLLMPQYTFLVAIQILFINLITDALPAISLSVEKAENDIMKKPPRNAKESVFANGIWQAMLLQVVVQTVSILLVFILTLKATNDNSLATTMAFVVLALGQLFNLVSVRSNLPIIKHNPFYNPFFWGTLIGGIMIVIAFVSIPLLSIPFGFVALSLEQWLIAFAIAIIIIPVMEVFKIIRYYKLTHAHGANTEIISEPVEQLINKK